MSEVPLYWVGRVLTMVVRLVEGWTRAHHGSEFLGDDSLTMVVRFGAMIRISKCCV
jgi:hypothetical protein